MIRCATSCYTWKDLLISRELSIEDSILRSRELGFDGYEIANLTDAWMDVPFSLAGMDRAARSCGIAIPSWAMAADWSLGIPSQVQKALREMDMAAELGVRMFRTDTYVSETENPYADEVTDALRELADEAGRRGMTLLTENHGTYLCTPERLLPLIKKVRSEHFGILYDGANFVSAGSDPLKAAEMLAPYVRHVHLKDALFVPGSRGIPEPGWQKTLQGDCWRCAVPGRGIVPYEKILKILLSAGFDGWLVQEFDGIDDPVSAMCEGLEYSRRLISQLQGAET